MSGIVSDIVNKKRGNRGETIVEVMVAFMVLLIVLALFGNSILAAGEAQKYAIDTRREFDQGMIQLQNAVYQSGTEPKATKTENLKEATVHGLDSEHAVKAVKYTTGDLTYWVFE